MNGNCKRLVYKDVASGDSTRIILGVILEETPDFIKFKTGKGNEYLINRSLIILLEDTNTPFCEETR